jgi:hypothetical protein
MAAEGEAPTQLEADETIQDGDYAVLNENGQKKSIVLIRSNG